MGGLHHDRPWRRRERYTERSGEREHLGARDADGQQYRDRKYHRHRRATGSRLTGAQLDAILIGAGTINLGGGTGDTIDLTSTSADLNTLGATNASIQGVEAISAATAGAGVTITLSAQSEGFAITGSANADIITGGTGVDTISAGGGDDTINVASGQLVAGKSIDGGTHTTGDAIVLTTAGTTANFSLGTVTNIETLTGSGGNNGDNDRLAVGGLHHDRPWRRRERYAERSGEREHLGARDADGQQYRDRESHRHRRDQLVTLTGAQLDAILIGAGTINLGAGAGDTINLTSTSTELNALADGSLSNVENISTVGATGAVTVTSTNQTTEGFTITSGTQGDTLTGGSQADTFVMSVDNVLDAINGNGGSDTVNYSAYSADLTVTLNGGTAVTVTGSGTTALLSDTIQNVENFIGGAGNDTLTGDANANKLIGGSGDRYARRRCGERYPHRWSRQRHPYRWFRHQRRPVPAANRRWPGYDNRLY